MSITSAIKRLVGYREREMSQMHTLNSQMKSEGLRYLESKRNVPAADIGICRVSQFEIHRVFA